MAALNYFYGPGPYSSLETTSFERQSFHCGLNGPIRGGRLYWTTGMMCLKLYNASYNTMIYLHNTLYIVSNEVIKITNWYGQNDA